MYLDMTATDINNKQQQLTLANLFQWKLNKLLDNDFILIIETSSFDS